MATILTRNGRRSIQFVDAAGHRKTLALGKVSQKQAEFFKAKVEALSAACITGHAPDDEVSAWLGKRDTVVLEKLAAVGLIAKRESSTLGAFIDRYVESRVDVKSATKEVWRQGRLGLVGFFGADRRMRDVTEGDADNYKQHLIGLGLASLTVRKRLQFAKTIFRAAVRHKLVAADPFADVSIEATMPDRMHFISTADTAKLLDACPSRDWRLITALSRYGGMRCPSEVLSLRWQDVDWERGRLTVTSPKTEHHPGKGTRVIPLFPELRPILEEAFEAAPVGAIYVVDEKHRKASMGKAGWRNCNLRTTFEKIIRRAGLAPWPRLFHNLRSSRETELCERFPMHVVTAWLGHTEEIARKHYCQVTDEHFRQASAPAQRAALALQQPAENAGTPKKRPGAGSESEDSGPDRKATVYHDLQESTTTCAAHVNPCAATRNGWGGIRTPGGLAPTAVFKTAALDHSATHPNSSMRLRNAQV